MYTSERIVYTWPALKLLSWREWPDSGGTAHVLGVGCTEKGGRNGSQCQPKQVETGVATHWGTDGCRRRGLELKSRCSVWVCNVWYTFDIHEKMWERQLDNESGVEGRGWRQKSGHQCILLGSRRWIIIYIKYLLYATKTIRKLTNSSIGKHGNRWYSFS